MLRTANQNHAYLKNPRQDRLEPLSRQTVRKGCSGTFELITYHSKQSSSYKIPLQVIFKKIFLDGWNVNTEIKLSCWLKKQKYYVTGEGT